MISRCCSSRPPPGGGSVLFLEQPASSRPDRSPPGPDSYLTGYHSHVTIQVTPAVSIPDDEIELYAIRSQGPGGQNVNKVASAVQLRFDIPASSLPEAWKRRLLSLNDRRITRDGILTIKAQDERSQKRNREIAQERLRELIAGIATVPKPRVPTRPSRAVKKRRVDDKKQRGRVKALRKPVGE